MVVKCSGVEVVYMRDDFLQEYPRFLYTFIGHNTNTGGFDHTKFDSFPVVEELKIISAVDGMYTLNKVYTLEGPRG